MCRSESLGTVRARLRCSLARTLPTLRTLMCGWATLGLVACAGLAPVTDPGGGRLQPYVEHSYDKNSVLFSTREGEPDRSTVFLDTVYPFDLPLRYQHAEPLVRYSLAHPSFLQDGVLMVALDDLRRLYAPSFSYRVDAGTRRFSVTHRWVDKQVVGGMGTRAPTVRYTQHLHTGEYAIGGVAANAVEVVHTGVTRLSDLPTAPVALRGPALQRSLDAAPTPRDGLVYVPVASFMRTLGKTVTVDAAQGWLAVSDVDPADAEHDLFNPAYKGGFALTPLTASRMRQMRALLDGTQATGNFWHAFYLGEVEVFTGQLDAQGLPVRAAQVVDRILPYRVYLPKGHDPRTPSKLVLMLHGATGNENAPFERLNDHLTRQPTPVPGVVTVEDYADRHGYVVLSPNGWTRNPQWAHGPGEVSLRMALDDVRRRHAIDPNRLFIAGNSAGGAGTLNVVLRHPGWFRAMAPTAPASNRPMAADLKGPILDLPTLMACYSADETVFYAGAPQIACQPWYRAQVKERLRDLTFVTVENGHHSYGAASLLQMTFEFFDRVLEGRPERYVGAVQLTVGQASARILAGRRAGEQVALWAAPLRRDGVVMVGLSDLARIYGEADFKVYDVLAYRSTPQDLVAVKTVLHNRVSVNLQPGSIFLRVGGSLRAGDSSGPNARLAATDGSIDPRALTVAPFEQAGQVWVPAAEFMQLFGRTLVTE